MEIRFNLNAPIRLMLKNLFLLLVALSFIACKKEPGAPTRTNSKMYFPPVGTSDWETITPASLQWDETALAQLYTFLESKNTKAFIVLKGGRKVAERYFGQFTPTSNWYWASAGKTLTAFLVGIAQAEGKLKMEDKTAQYLGAGWTSLPPAKEAGITIHHQLTMTTGLDDNISDVDCTLPECLQYKSDAGTRWAYHNAPYTLLEKVVERATGTTYNQYFKQKVGDKIGMDGLWVKVDYNNVFFSTPRSMARFGLLMLNGGQWDETKILDDAAYFTQQTNSSQTLNPSYGYLTWLNGKSSYRLPQTQFTFNGPLIPNAPADTYAALGKNDQKIYVVPSQQLVVIRMGESAGNIQLAASSFDNELWGKLKAVVKW